MTSLSSRSLCSEFGLLSSGRASKHATFAVSVRQLFCLSPRQQHGCFWRSVALFRTRVLRQQLFTHCLDIRGIPWTQQVLLHSYAILYTCQSSPVKMFSWVPWNNNLFHEIISHEIFATRKFPNLRYIMCLHYAKLKCHKGTKHSMFTCDMNHCLYMYTAEAK